MNPPQKPSRFFRTTYLTWPRIIVALTVAVCADGLQLCLGFVGWVFPNQIIDVVTMVLTAWLIGFHLLLLPTFVVELIPLLDDLPTWTACVIAVIIIRKREQCAAPPIIPSKPTGEI